MIKRYNQFVQGRTNEEFEMGEGQPAPSTTPAEPTTVPDTPTRPRPTRPGPTPTEIPSEQDAPLAYGYNNDLPEEEGGEYQGQYLMNQLASELGVEVESDGSINYEGKKINFYSETEKFHVDNKKFAKVEEVIDYLGSIGPKVETEEEVVDELSDVEELESNDDAFESKSYRKSRLKKFN